MYYSLFLYIFSPYNFVIIVSAMGCSTSEGWQVGGDHIHSGRGHADDAYLVLSLKVRFELWYYIFSKVHFNPLQVEVNIDFIR